MWDDTIKRMLKYEIVDKDGNLDEEARKTLEGYLKDNEESFNKLDELEKRLNSAET